MNGGGFDPSGAHKPFVKLFHLEDQVGCALSHGNPHLLEQPSTFSFVLDFRINLGVSHQPYGTA